MISFDFSYYKPVSIEEAILLYQTLTSQGKKAMYYAGGTEIITGARINQIVFDAVIDLKGITECVELKYQNQQLIIGSCITLTQICESNVFPLLTQVVRGIADHTSRNKITIGGNICGAIPYREAVLPFLLCDSQLVLAGPKGNRIVSISDIFNEKLQIRKGELLVQIITDGSYINLPYESLKKTKQSKVDYPLLTIAAIKASNGIRIATSGLSPHPFRCAKIEAKINNNGVSIQDRAIDSTTYLEGRIISDIQGSVEYKKYVFLNTLEDILNNLEGGI